MVVVLMDADDGHVIERWVFEPKVVTVDSMCVHSFSGRALLIFHIL